MRTSPGWVLDASVAIKLLVEEEESDRAAALLDDPLCAPDFLGVECANALWRKAKQGALTAVEASERVVRLSALPIRPLRSATLLVGALSRAIRHGHPVYDCLYLEAAAVTGLTLVTADRRLARLADDGAEVVLLSDLPPA